MTPPTTIGETADVLVVFDRGSIRPLNFDWARETQSHPPAFGNGKTRMHTSPSFLFEMVIDYDKHDLAQSGISATSRPQYVQVTGSGVENVQFERPEPVQTKDGFPSHPDRISVSYTCERVHTGADIGDVPPKPSGYCSDHGLEYDADSGFCPICESDYHP